jgi:hypothetical protein
MAGLLVSFPLYADAPKDVPATVMLQPGKLLVSEDLNQPFGKEWFGNPGKWEVVDKVMRGSERSEDMHAAVRRRNVKFDSAIVQFSFKLDGAKGMSLSMNAEKGHVCRVRITPDGFAVIRDKDKKKNEKPAVLDKYDVKITPKEWHTMVVEMHGKDMVARLDGKQVALGTHDGLTVTKASVGFTVSGESVSFKNLRVYEGTLMKGWAEIKAKLLADRKK